MRSRLLVVCSMLLMVCTVNVYAANVKNGSGAPQARYVGGKITIKADGETLGGFVTRLSKVTGVRVTAEKDVADLRLAVFAKALPLPQLVDAMQKSLHVESIKTVVGGKVLAYHFYQDESTKQEMATLKQDELSTLRNAVVSLSKQLADMEAKGEDPLKMVAPGNGAFQGLPQKMDANSPSLDYLLKSYDGSGVLAALTMYSALTPAQADSIWNGDSVKVFAGNLPPDVQAKLTKRVTTWTDTLRSNQGRPGGKKEIVLHDIDSFYLFVGSNYTSNKKVLNYGVELKQPKGPDGNLPYTSGYGSVLDIEQLTGGGPRFAFESGSTSSHFKLGLKNPNAYKALEYISDKTGISIVSDYWTRLKQPMFILSQMNEFPSAGSALDCVANWMQSTVSKEKNLRILSSNTWYSDRDREISPSLLARFRQEKKAHGGFNINDAIDMAKSLTSDQMEDLQQYGIGNGYSLAACRGALRVLGSLTPEQWKQARVPEEEWETESHRGGLPLSQLNDQQFALVMDWAQGKGGGSTYSGPESSVPLTPEIIRQSFLGVSVMTFAPGEAGGKQWNISIGPESEWKEIPNTDGSVTYVSNTLLSCSLDLGGLSGQVDRGR